MSAATQAVDATQSTLPIRAVTSAADPVISAPNGVAPKLDPAVMTQVETANLNLLGQVTWLMSLSPQHKHLFLADLEWRVRPPILLRQCRIFHSKGRPVAFVSWAMVNTDVARRLKQMPIRLQPHEWRCGDLLTLVDVAAPFGGAERFVNEAISKLTKPSGAVPEERAAQ